jgi:uncharacterized protein (UPF0333 family)
MQGKMSGNKERCINPWFGFLFIVVVCIIIAAAIFLEFNGSRRQGKAALKAKPKKAAAQVAFPSPPGEYGAAGEKFVF